MTQTHHTFTASMNCVCARDESDWLVQLEQDVLAKRRTADESVCLAARVASFDTGIRHTELQCAVAWTVIRVGGITHETADDLALTLASTLATDRRRRQLRNEIRQRAEVGAQVAPGICEALRSAAEEQMPVDPADDPLWVGAVMGLAFARESGASKLLA
jgi:hypothetical protein